MTDNFKADLKILDDNETWNNTASKLKCTLKNVDQSKNFLINKTLKDSYQDQDVIGKRFLLISSNVFKNNIDLKKFLSSKFS